MLPMKMTAWFPDIRSQRYSESTDHTVYVLIAAPKGFHKCHRRKNRANAPDRGEPDSASRTPKPVLQTEVFTARTPINGTMRTANFHPVVYRGRLKVGSSREQLPDRAAHAGSSSKAGGYGLQPVRARANLTEPSSSVDAGRRYVRPFLALRARTLATAGDAQHRRARVPSLTRRVESMLTRPHRGIMAHADDPAPFALSQYLRPDP